MGYRTYTQFFKLHHYHYSHLALEYITNTYLEPSSPDPYILWAAGVYTYVVQQQHIHNFLKTHIPFTFIKV